MGIKMGVQKTVEVEAAYLHLYVKARDSGTYTLLDSDGNELAELEDYVPNSIIPGEFGDYIDLKIDLSTGQIVNWKVPTKEALTEAFFPSKD